MDKDDKKLSQIRKFLDEAEEKIQSAKRILFEQVYQEQAEHLSDLSSNSAVIEGVFNGEVMIDRDGKKYQVPANYCSKSKLVAGDNLKLTVLSDGTFVFKQIGPVERKRIIGKVSRSGDEWFVTAEGKKYRCLQAALTYFKAKEGDKVTIILPRTGETQFAAVENLISE